MHASALILLALTLVAAAVPARHRFDRPKKDSGLGRPKDSKAGHSTDATTLSPIFTGIPATQDPAPTSLPAVAAAAATPTSQPPQVVVSNTTVGATGDLQGSFTLEPSVIQTGFQNNGKNPPVAEQFPSLTSTNNLLNFCALTLPGTPLTNGKQITTAPVNTMDNFAYLQAGHFTNAQESYFATPQQLNAQGMIIGHTHVVIDDGSSHHHGPQDLRLLIE